MRQFTTQAKLFVLILSSLWLSPNKILAQLTLEATYPTTDLRRIQLPTNATFTPPNGLPQGVYWCQISDGKSQIVKKLIKMN